MPGYEQQYQAHKIEILKLLRPDIISCVLMLQTVKDTAKKYGVEVNGLRYPDIIDVLKVDDPQGGDKLLTRLKRAKRLGIVDYVPGNRNWSLGEFGSWVLYNTLQADSKAIEEWVGKLSNYLESYCNWKLPIEGT